MNARWLMVSTLVLLSARSVAADTSPVLQGYVSANLNHSGSTYLDVGKWYSPAGTESVVAQNNWLYCGGVLLGFAVPSYHFGARAFHYFSDTDYVMLGLERGWNNVGN